MAMRHAAIPLHRDTVQDLAEAARLRHVLETCMGDSSPDAIASCRLALHRLARLQLSKEAVRGLHLGRVAKQLATEGPPPTTHAAEALCDMWRALLRSGPLDAFCQAEARLRLEPAAPDIAILVDTEPLLGASKLEQEHRRQACMTLKAIASTTACEQSLKSLAESAIQKWPVELASSSDQRDLTASTKNADDPPATDGLTAAPTHVANTHALAAEPDAEAAPDAETEAEVGSSIHATFPEEWSSDAGAEVGSSIPATSSKERSSDARDIKFEACCHGRALLLAVALRAAALKEREMCLGRHCSMQQSLTGDSDCADWCRFYDEKSARHWWKHMGTGLSFCEGDPAWQKYKDPASGRRWWWHSFSGEWFYEPLLNDDCSGRGDVASQSGSGGAHVMTAEVLRVHDVTSKSSFPTSSVAPTRRRWGRRV